MTTHNDSDPLGYFKLAKENEELRQELDRIKGGLSWQAYEAIDRSPLGPALRRFMKVVGAPIRRRLARKGTPTASHQPPTNHPDKLMPSQETWLAAMRQQQPDAIAILHPEWRGIRRAMTTLFPAYYFLDDTVDAEKAQTLAKLIRLTPCMRIVYGGFPHSYQHVVEELATMLPYVKQYVIWFGNLLQSWEDYNWHSFKLAHRLCQNGLIDKLGFAKQGMAEAVAKSGVPAEFVMSYIADIPTGPSVPLPNGPHVGVWGLEYNWRKLPFAMLAATLFIPEAKVHGSVVQHRSQEFSALMGVNWVSPEAGVIEQSKMGAKLAQMDLNLYVTLSECWPMLPLESLSVGVPCLTGPTSFMFEDHDYLHEMLVVQYPDSSQAIAIAAQRALAERNKIIQNYIEYAPDYNQRAIESVATFLDMR